MKKTSFLVLGCFLSLVSFGQVKTTGSSFSAKVKGIDVKVEFYTPDIVRVYKTAESSILEQKKDFVVELAPQNPSVKISNANGVVKAKSSALEVALDLKTGKVTQLLCT